MAETQDASVAQSKATDALADIDPEGLRTRAESQLQDSTWTPARLVLYVADATDAEHDAANRAASVQMVYAGLASTDGFIDEPPWESADGRAEREQANVGLLATEVLVGRGFHRLAPTPAASAATESVRVFASERSEQDGSTAEFEAAVCRMAISAGCAVDVEPTPDCGEIAVEAGVLHGGLDEVDASEFFI